MPLHASPWPIRKSSPERALMLLAGAMVGLSAVMPAVPAAAQYLIYEQPYGREPPPIYAPPPRGPLHYVMLPPGEVLRRLQAMGYWQISRPRLVGRVYSLTAVDEEGEVSLLVDAYSGEVLGVQPLSALPPGPAYGRAPVVPPARVTTVAPRPMAPSAPLPQPRPAEADIALSTPAEVPVAPAVAAPVIPPQAPAGQTPVGSTPAAALATPNQATPNQATPAQAMPAQGTPAQGTPAQGTPAQAVPARPAPVQIVPANAAAAEADSSAGGKGGAALASSSAAPAAPTGAGSATPGSSDTGSASVLSRPAGTE